MELAGIIQNEFESSKFDEKPVEILVDSIGIGSGTTDRLIELGLPARGINVAESPSMAQKYMRLRDELWYRSREWFEAKDLSLIHI